MGDMDAPSREVWVVIKHTPTTPKFEVVSAHGRLEQALDKRRAKGRGRAGEWYEKDGEWTTRSRHYQDSWYPYYTATKTTLG